jgi:hypothetical protein
MRYFPLFDLQAVILLSFLGVTALLLLYIAMGKLIGPAGRQPIPLILVFVYAGFVVWAVAYVVVVGIGGAPF